METDFLANANSQGRSINQNKHEIDDVNFKGDKKVNILNSKPGWYLEVVINEKPIDFLVDTGSSLTVVDDSVYQKISECMDVPIAKTDLEVSCADGHPFELLGEINVEMKINELEISQNVAVATLGENCGVLGLDFLENHDCVLFPVKGKLKLGSKMIKLHRRGSNRCCRLVANKSVIVPPKQAMFVKGRVKNRGCQTALNVGLIEPSANFIKQSNLLVDRVIVERNESKPSLLMINLGNCPVRIRAGTSIATVQDVSRCI